MSEAERPRSGLSQASSTVTISSVSMGSRSHSTRPVRKVHTFGKRGNSIKRDPNSPVIMRGWLYKQDSSGLKLWKRRWFVLSNYCLFYYRDSREEMILGSILLPSYEIRTAFSKEKKNRRFIFKAEHPGMRTYYFSAETQLDMNSWIKAMKQAATAECDCGNYNRGLQSQSVSTCTSFEDVTLTQDDYTKSVESLEIARLSEKQEGEASSSESLHVPDSRKGSPCLRRTSLSSSLNGGYSLKRKDQPDLSSLSSQTHGSPSPVACPKFSSRPRSPPPPSSESPSPSSPPRTPQPSPLLSIRSSRSYSLPLNPAESPQVPAARQSPTAIHRKPPRSAAPQATSCEDLSAGNSVKTLGRPNTPMGRVDIAPSEGPPSNPYAASTPTTRGRTLTPADRYDVFPSSEDPYGRRYARSPHPSRIRLMGEEVLTPSPGRQPPNRFADRAYLSPPSGTSRALVMSRFHGRLITPHSASSSYLHLPPLPPLSNRPTPGKRTSLGTTCRTPVRERSVSSAGGQRFESDTDALLTKLCGQDKLLRGLEDETGQLRAEKERLEKALEVTRLRMEEFKGQDATLEKICYQQRQLQDELVQIRARLCDLALDSERAWEDYVALENDLHMLKGSLEHVRSVGHPQDQAAAQQDLWRIHDILAGLRSSAASCHALESRRSGVSPATTPNLDSPSGPNHSSQPPCTGAEDSETASSPKLTPSFHESPPSHIPATAKPGGTVGHLENRQVDTPSAGDQPQSPPASSRGQQQASERMRRSQHNSTCEPPESEKGKLLARGTELIGPVHASHTNILCEGAEHGKVKTAPSEASAPRRSRMSAQEQLDRIQRNQEAKRKSEGAQCSPLGHWRDSLKRGSSRPLPNSPPEPSSKEGVQSGGLKPPRCPPTPEWERQRVIQLSYALAAEASQQRGKRIAGRTSSRSSLDNLSTSHDSPTHHLPKDNFSIEPEANGTISEHSQTDAQPPNSRDNTRTANLEISLLQTTNQVSCDPEASDPSSSLSEEPVLSSKARTPQVTSHLVKPTSEELPLPNGPHWVVPLPQLANQNSSVSQTANWASAPSWDCEVWQSEQSLVGRQGLVNGRCHKWRGENKSHQVITYLSETSQPVKVTLVKSSF